MTNKTLIASCIIILSVLIIGCSRQTEIVSTPITGTGDVSIANPASVYCVKQGYQIETHTDAEGNQYGDCVFSDGSECDEWEFFRGECEPDVATASVENKAIEAAKIVLANQQGVDANLITIFSLEQITWPDSCLGIAAQGESCTAVETPGFRVILTIGEDHYTYHTDLTGENIRQETAGGHPD